MVLTSGKEALIQILRHEGIEYILGVPGATETHFMDVLEDRGAGLDKFSQILLPKDPFRQGHLGIFDLGRRQIRIAQGGKLEADVAPFPVGRKLLHLKFRVLASFPKLPEEVKGPWSGQKQSLAVGVHESRPERLLPGYPLKLGGLIADNQIRAFTDQGVGVFGRMEDHDRAGAKERFSGDGFSEFNQTFDPERFRDLLEVSPGLVPDGVRRIDPIDKPIFLGQSNLDSMRKSDSFGLPPPPATVADDETIGRTAPFATGFGPSQIAVQGRMDKLLGRMRSV